jgi:hypothetical protein
LLVPQRMLQEWVTRFSFATNQQLSEIFGVPEYVIELQKFYA